MASPWSGISLHYQEHDLYDQLAQFCTWGANRPQIVAWFGKRVSASSLSRYFKMLAPTQLLVGGRPKKSKFLLRANGKTKSALGSVLNDYMSLRLKNYDQFSAVIAAWRVHLGMMAAEPARMSDVELTFDMFLVGIDLLQSYRLVPTVCRACHGPNLIIDDIQCSCGSCGRSLKGVAQSHGAYQRLHATWTGQMSGIARKERLRS